MTTRMGKAVARPVSAILLAAAMVGVQTAQAGTWQKNAAGTYSWIDGGNWDAAFPNAAGAAASFALDLTGNQTVNLNQAITIGTLTAGDTNGASALTIGSGTGGNPLVFQGAAPGTPATINLNSSTTSGTGSDLTFASGVKLGGTSPLNLRMNGTLAAAYNVTASGLNLNGNVFTVTGPSNPQVLVAPTAVLNLGVLGGGGAFVQNGGTVNLQDNAAFTGAVTVYSGSFFIGNLASASQITVAGAFETTGPTVNGNTPGKYPIGGILHLGNPGWPLVTTLPDRLNHNGTLAFNGGGYMVYSGQGLDSSLAGQAVVEQVKQIRFNPGMSELGLANGNGVSSSTTLLANDASNAMVRQQGATFMIGGDVPNAWAGIGNLYKLKFNSGMAGELKGGGGAAGSLSVSIIPWMTCGTIYHPGQGQFATYDSANGVRCLADNECYTGTVYGAAATVNVRNSDLNLGANHTQTVNAYVTNSWSNTDIGPGSTLTVSSGLFYFYGSGGSLGNGAPANAGTLNFGASEGIIWSHWQAFSPNVVGSVIAGSGGLTTAGTNVLILKAANTYTGKTVVGAGILQIGDGTLTTSRLGAGDVEVTTGATLRIKANVANGIADSAILTLDNAGDAFFGKMELEGGVNEAVGGLVLGGASQLAGTYGSSLSSASYQNDTYFSGSGVLTVAVPEPASLAFLGVAMLAMQRQRRVP